MFVAAGRACCGTGSGISHGDRAAMTGDLLPSGRAARSPSEYWNSPGNVAIRIAVTAGAAELVGAGTVARDLLVEPCSVRREACEIPVDLRGGTMRRTGGGTADGRSRSPPRRTTSPSGSGRPKDNERSSAPRRRLAGWILSQECVSAHLGRISANGKQMKFDWTFLAKDLAAHLAIAADPDVAERLCEMRGKTRRACWRPPTSGRRWRTNTRGGPGAWARR